MQHWSALTLREQIAQTVIAQTWYADLFRERGGLGALLAEYPVGGIFIGGEVIKHAVEGQEDAQAVIRKWQGASPLPLIVCADFENGCGSAMPGLTPLPHLMALGATRDEDLAYEYGKVTALEGRAVGVNWALAPVADLQQNRWNPITNYRSIGSDPESASRMLARLIHGMQDHGMAATAKHFPGDGTDHRDQHMYTTSNRLSWDAWQQQHGAVFQHLIDQDIAAIMTGHIALPSYQQMDRRGDRCLPATLSHELTTKLLKETMRFSGVVMSDALIMGGFIQWHDQQVQAEVDCFAAGTDLLLWPSLEYVDAMEAAIQRGDVPLSRLHDALTRIWRWKERLAEDVEAPEMAQTQRQAQDLGRRVAEQSVTVIRDRQQRLPLRADAYHAVLLVLICRDTAVVDEVSGIVNALEQRGMTVRLERNLDFSGRRQLSPEFDLIINLLYTGPHHPMGVLGFTEQEAFSLWGTACAGREKTITICLGSPYQAVDDAETADCCLLTYSPVVSAQEAAIRALLGEIPAIGIPSIELA